jgi:adenylate kinase family enzyme
MQKQFFIIMGRSGSGKGTQADLLKAKLEAAGAESVLHITTGGGFRDFMGTGSYAAGLTKDIANNGGLLPEFLGVWNWANIFIQKLKGNETVMLDGAPRRLAEVESLHSALHFFGYSHGTVIYIDVSETWAMDKLTSRGRDDDASREEQERKMAWFAQDVLPCIDIYTRDPRYKFIHVNGEQTIDDVHQEVMTKLG